MPLIIICGTPVSGKTTRVIQLKEFFENTHKKQVEVVSEDETIKKLGYEKNSTYLDPQKEKRIRGHLKSEVIRLIGKDSVVILDGSNYIKGYRYELYCASKASKSTQCTIYTIRNHQEAWESNLLRTSRNTENTTNNANTSGAEPYSEEVFNTLTKFRTPQIMQIHLVQSHIVRKCLTHLLSSENTTNNANTSGAEPYSEEVFNTLTKFRFEEPNSNNRWDSPLFTVQPSDDLDLDAVYKVLFEKKPPPPNMSTQNPPLSSTNFLYEIDKITQAISRQILDSKKLNLEIVRFPDYPECFLEVGIMHIINPQKLLMLRRQFLTFAKMNHSNEDAQKIGRYFIQYLNKTLTV